MGGPHSDGDPREARDRHDSAHNLRRPEGSLILEKPRRKISYANAPAVAVFQFGLDDGRVANIGSFRMGDVGQNDVGEALFLVPCQKTGKSGIRIEAGKAPPNDAPAGVDQRRHATIADQSKIKRLLIWRPFLVL
jgi:hypothetical protein